MTRYPNNGPSNRVHNAATLARTASFASDNPDIAEAALQDFLDERRAKKRRRNCITRVYKAVKSGKLERKPCVVCGSRPTHAHHFDYSRPLDVIWLCPKCHK